LLPRYSSLFMFGPPPCSDDEPILGRYRYGVELVVAFFQPGTLPFSEGTRDARSGNFLLPPTLFVSANRIPQRNVKEARDDTKTNGSGRCNVLGAVAWQRILVIDDKRLFCLVTGGEQKSFPLPCSQHIQANANVIVEETLAMERSLPRALNAHEDYGFRRRITNQTFRPP
jgi:hypothetical protein